jgi:4,5-DOPA dioxygenase extradiol
MDKSAQIVYFSHGGGPLPILGDPSHQAMLDFMVQLPTHLRKPDAVLVISAHWEEHDATLLGSAAPPMFYDYYGFPPQAYQITYPAPGDPRLAERIAGLLEKNGIPAHLDGERGFDHGLFIPLKMMYPKAEIPCLQLSLLRGLNPAAHIALGKALGDLRQENILVIGSGFSFHNLSAFRMEIHPRPDPINDAFQDWLIETCTAPFSQEERMKRLLEWEKAPSARYCHPREEHLLPLHVCAAMADIPGRLIFDDMIAGKRSVAFQW